MDDTSDLSQCVVNLNASTPVPNRDLESYDAALGRDSDSQVSTTSAQGLDTSATARSSRSKKPNKTKGKGENSNKNKKKNPREAYLITYSQADVVKVPGREHFANMVVQEFDRNDSVSEKWVVSAELHRNHGIHYHLALKLKKPRRFKEVRNAIKNKYDIDLDFQEWHSNYHDAFSYVVKFDSHYVTSPRHVILSNPPRTTKATEAKRAQAQHSSEAPPKRKKSNLPPKLGREDVGNIIRENGIKSVKELFSLAHAQAKEGKTDLRGYLYTHPDQSFMTKQISTVVGIELVEDEAIRDNMSRLDILRQAKDGECAKHPVTRELCNGLWLSSALEVLRLNDISRGRFTELVLNALWYGRSKGYNLMICGKSNCAKSFMLMPLIEIFDCFMTPSPGNYNWVGAPEKEIVFLNDLRYEKDGEQKVMAWNLFLNLLEGFPVNMPGLKIDFQRTSFGQKDNPFLQLLRRKLFELLAENLMREKPTKWTCGGIF
eukprot:TCONS_00035585-protein